MPEELPTRTGSATGSGAERPRVRFEVAGASADEAMHRLPTLYGGSSWDTHRTGSVYDFRYTAVGDAVHVSLRSSRMRGHLVGDIPPGEDLVVQWLLAGSGVVDRGRGDVPMRLGRPNLFPADRSFVFDYTDYDQRLVHLNRGLVEAVAAERYAFRRGGLTFDHRAIPAASAVARWRDAVAQVTVALRNGAVGSVLWAEASRTAVEAFLAMYPPVAPQLPEPLLSPRNAHLRAVVELIHESAHLPLTVGELAAVAGLTPRALQFGFQRIFGSTPLEYLRQVRLDRVRTELRLLGPNGTTVAEVARRWGFSHLGRFSGAYLQRFGEYPRDTLAS